MKLIHLRDDSSPADSRHPAGNWSFLLPSLFAKLLTEIKLKLLVKGWLLHSSTLDPSARQISCKQSHLILERMPLALGQRKYYLLWQKNAFDISSFLTYWPRFWSRHVKTQRWNACTYICLKQMKKSMSAQSLKWEHIILCSKSVTAAECSVQLQISSHYCIMFGDKLIKSPPPPVHCRSLQSAVLERYEI